MAGALGLLLAMFQPGDRVRWLSFRKGRRTGRFVDDVDFIPATVVRVTAQRVTVDLDGRAGSRRVSVTPRKLIRPK